jgi:DNA-binding MarR family transcriptional regulator
MYNSYLDVISLIERVHRHFLELVKVELDELDIRDINNVQGLILFNIGDAEMPIGELTSRGCYLGSNVSHNVKKLAETGYLSQKRSLHDRRSINVRLTKKGAKMRDRLQNMHQRHAEMLKETTITDEDLRAATITLRRLEHYWTLIPDLSDSRLIQPLALPFGESRQR